MDIARGIAAGLMAAHAVERVILRCLHHDPAQRPRSAREVIDALPGGDPLAAAMAAGETPSPRIIAAAGSAGTLKPVVAWTLLLAIVGVLSSFLILARNERVLQTLGLDDPPEVQAARASEMLRRFGIPRQQYNSFGFEEQVGYYGWIFANDSSPQRWNRLARVLMLLTMILRRRALAVAALFLLFMLAYSAASREWWMFPGFVLNAGLTVFLVARFGLLTMVAAHMTFVASISYPRPDTAEWYTARGLVGVVFVLALAIWAFRTSLGDQRAFGTATLDD